VSSAVGTFEANGAFSTAPRRSKLAKPPDKLDLAGRRGFVLHIATHAHRSEGASAFVGPVDGRSPSGPLGSPPFVGQSNLSAPAIPARRSPVAIPAQALGATWAIGPARALLRRDPDVASKGER
jgi:hypothetical protein